MRETPTRTNGVHPPPAALDGDGSFAPVAREQLRRIDWLLGCRGARSRQRCLEGAGVEWTPDCGDPEFRKNLRILARLIGGAEGVCRRRRLPRSVVAQVTEAVSLPNGMPLTIEPLLRRRFQLEALLIEIGDDEYLRERAAEAYNEREGAIVCWCTLYRDRPPPILAGMTDAAGLPGRDATEVTRAMLQQLIAAKHYADLPVRSRRELTRRALMFVAPVVLLAAVAFAIAIAVVEDGDGVLQLAAAAGATGAALGRLIRVRDDLVPGSQRNDFALFFVAQVVVGATAGMLAFLVDRSGIVSVGGDASGLAAVSFALGFTEAAYVHLIARVADLSGGGASAAPRPVD